jgi:hypothetical protein
MYFITVCHFLHQTSDFLCFLLHFIFQSFDGQLMIWCFIVHFPNQSPSFFMQFHSKGVLYLLHLKHM